MLRLPMLMALCLSLAQTACRTADVANVHRPRLNHVVLFTLHDPDDAGPFIADCDARLSDLPGVTAYAVGSPLPAEREVAVTDYDVGVSLGFASAEDLREYLAHPLHRELVSAWQSRIRRMRVIDIIDHTP